MTNKEAAELLQGIAERRLMVHNDSISRKGVLKFLKDMEAVVPDDDLISSAVKVTIECARRFVTSMPPVYDWSLDNSNRCVCCGELIPEGRQVCPSCERKASENRAY